jgi:hypothetical protein
MRRRGSLRSAATTGARRVLEVEDALRWAFRRRWFNLAGLLVVRPERVGELRPIIGELRPTFFLGLGAPTISIAKPPLLISMSLWTVSVFAACRGDRRLAAAALRSKRTWRRWEPAA